jgi:hypothetical protein
MNSPGLLIAAGVVILYTLVGPLVLFGIYTLFDSLTHSEDKKSSKVQASLDSKDPALWSEEDLDRYFSGK